MILFERLILVPVKQNNEDQLNRSKSKRKEVDHAVVAKEPPTQRQPKHAMIQEGVVMLGDIPEVDELLRELNRLKVERIRTDLVTLDLARV